MRRARKWLRTAIGNQDAFTDRLTATNEGTLHLTDQSETGIHLVERRERELCPVEADIMSLDSMVTLERTNLNLRYEYLRLEEKCLHLHDQGEVGWFLLRCLSLRTV